MEVRCYATRFPHSASRILYYSSTRTRIHALPHKTVMYHNIFGQLIHISP